MTALLSTDLDGTFVFGRTVADRDVDALRRWREAGNLLVPNTGKSIFATDLVLGPPGVTFDYAICYTGAVVISGDHRVLAQRTLPPGLVASVWDAYGDVAGVNVYATTLEHDYLLSDNAHEEQAILTSFLPLERDQLDAMEFVGVPLFAKDADVRDEILAYCIATWGDSADCHRNQSFLDLVPVGCTKGSGLQDLLDLLDGPRPEIWTIGDSWNDLDMHRMADHAVCLPWSPSEVTDACERQVPTIADLIDSILGAS